MLSAICLLLKLKQIMLEKEVLACHFIPIGNILELGWMEFYTGMANVYGETGEAMMERYFVFSSRLIFLLSMQWNSGMPHGKGRFCFSQDLEYEGNVERGVIHGQGVFRLLGCVYTGYFKHGKISGEGIARWGNTDAPFDKSFDGNWDGGQPRGVGTLHLKDGAELSGCFGETGLSGPGR